MKESNNSLVSFDRCRFSIRRSILLFLESFEKPLIIVAILKGFDFSKFEKILEIGTPVQIIVPSEKL